MAREPKVARIAKQVEAKTHFRLVPEASRSGIMEKGATCGGEHGFFLFYNHKASKPFHKGDMPLMLNLVHQMGRGDMRAFLTIGKHPEGKAFDVQIDPTGINHVSWKSLTDAELENCLGHAFAMRGLMREKQPDPLPEKLKQAISVLPDSLSCRKRFGSKTLSTANVLVGPAEAHVTGKQLDTQGKKFDITPQEIKLAKLGLKGTNLNDKEMENALTIAIYFQRITRQASASE